jgi:site-specific DNA recombinase
MNAKTARPIWFPPGCGPAARGRSTRDMRVNGEPERWVVAARLSRVAKRDRERGDDVINGIQTQDLRSTEWAQHEGHVIVHVSRDKNVSGAVAPWERPGLGPWLTDPVKLVQYDGIVAFDVSRLSREYFDLAWMRKWAEANNKKLYVIKERLHWPDNRDGTLWEVAAERAYEERQEITERITRELDALRDAGKLTSRPPFGYVSAGEKYDRHLVPTDEGRKYVPLIFQHCIDGWSLDKIAKWLNSEGVKLPGSAAWWANTVRGVIRNPVHKGQLCERGIVPPDEVEERDGKVVRYRYGGTWIETPRWQYGKTVHRCEALVNATIWKRANESLSSREKRGHYDPENRAMLAEAMSCLSCEDTPMYRTGERPYLYYRCAGRGSHRSSCGNMVRLELVDAAVNEIMASTFDVPVMRHEIVYGNEPEIEAETQRIKFELKQLAARELAWEEEDRERARLREEQTRVANTTVVEDRVELVETDDTYLELWERLNVQDRGPWLVEHGFRVTASKERVTVSQGPASATVELSAPERRALVRDTELMHWGKCECGCDTDIYGVKWRRKRYLDGAHRTRAIRRSAPAVVQEKRYLGECECGCGTDIYGVAGHGRKMYVNIAHGKRARRQRAAAGEGKPAERRPSRANTVDRSEPVPTPATPDPELVYRGKCACGCGSDVYGSKHAPQMKYVNSAHQIRANNARAARRRAARDGQTADPQEP